MTNASNIVSLELLSLLRCTLTRSPLVQEGDYLVAQVGGLKYPVRDRIPVMLVEEALLPAGFDSLEEFKKRFSPAPGR